MIALFAFTCLAAIPTPAAFQVTLLSDVDEIVRRHIAARGGEAALRALETLVYSEGQYSEGDFHGSSDAHMAFKRPFLRSVGNPEQPGGFREGYDGAAWEWYADPGVVLRTVGPASEAIRHNSALDGPFLDYRKKGTQLELLGSEEIDGRPAYRLRVTLRDGFSSDAFFDHETFLVTAARMSAPLHAYGEEVASESRFLDQRPVAGVLFPHRDVSVRLDTGETLSEMRWGKIEANRLLPDEWFRPPAYARTPTQSFLEQLYVQRSDPKAVLWTYHEVRRSHPDWNTRAGVEFIGFQMSKMGDGDSAVALLLANAADYPEAPSALIELGQAQRTLGNLDEARWCFENALILDPENEAAIGALDSLD